MGGGTPCGAHPPVDLHYSHGLTRSASSSLGPISPLISSMPHQTRKQAMSKGIEMRNGKAELGDEFAMMNRRRKKKPTSGGPQKMITANTSFTRSPTVFRSLSPNIRSVKPVFCSVKGKRYSFGRCECANQCSLKS